MKPDAFFMVLPPALLALFQLGRVIIDAFFNVLWVLW